MMLEPTDVAVLRLQRAVTLLSAISLGDSDALQVCDLCLSIGNPVGLGQTATLGIRRSRIIGPREPVP
jgi:S1-C subfamily serine protease